MAFILSLGFQDLVDDQGQKYGILNPSRVLRSPHSRLGMRYS